MGPRSSSPTTSVTSAGRGRSPRLRPHPANAGYRDAQAGPRPCDAQEGMFALAEPLGAEYLDREAVGSDEIAPNVDAAVSPAANVIPEQEQSLHPVGSVSAKRLPVCSPLRLPRPRRGRPTGPKTATRSRGCGRGAPGPVLQAAGQRQRAELLEATDPEQPVRAQTPGWSDLCPVDHRVVAVSAATPSRGAS
jgi:hypothetical protein